MRQPTESSDLSENRGAHTFAASLESLASSVSKGVSSTRPSPIAGRWTCRCRMAMLASSLSPREEMEQLVADEQTSRRGHRRARPRLLVSRCFDARDCLATMEIATRGVVYFTAGQGGRRQRPAASGREFAPRPRSLAFAVADFKDIIELFLWSCFGKAIGHDFN